MQGNDNAQNEDSGLTVVDQALQLLLSDLIVLCMRVKPFQITMAPCFSRLLALTGLLKRAPQANALGCRIANAGKLVVLLRSIPHSDIYDRSVGTGLLASQAT